jgi:acetylornithine deacetylase/succinyl-diaminopimelate desuccinylase-like protein
MMIDVDRILADAHSIAFPRLAGTEGDPRARAIIADAMRACGLDVEEEPFTYDLRPALRALRTVLVSSGMLVGGAGALALWSASSALALLLGGLLVGGVLLAWAPGVERGYRGEGPTATANVVGRRPSAERRMTLVVMAHHDSKSQNLIFPVRMGLTLLALAGALGLLAVLLSGLLLGAPPGPRWFPAAFGGGAGACLLVLATLRSGNRSPGGVDNAGSVGIMLELARVLPRRVPRDIELVFLATGAEEDHMVGAMRWLDAHQDELGESPAYAINFDGAGARGRVVLLERYGFRRWFSKTLSRAAHRMASVLEIRVRSVTMPPAMGIDAIPFAHRGLECLTFSSGALGRAVMAIHSARDRPENLDREALGQVATLALGLAQDLARKPEPWKRPRR